MPTFAALPLSLLVLASQVEPANGPRDSAQIVAPLPGIPVDLSKHQRSARNTVYVELGGSALVYSLNYERFISDRATIRVGGAYYGSLFVVPVTASYVRLLHGSHGLELGLGVALIRRMDPVAVSHTIGTAIVGYRYAPTAGGLDFRVALTPLVGDADPRVTYPGAEPNHRTGDVWLNWRAGVAAGWAF